MGKIQAKSIFRLVPLIGDLGRFLWAFTLTSSSVKPSDNLLTIFLVLPVKIIIKATWPLLAKSLFVPEVEHKVQILGNLF